LSWCTISYRFNTLSCTITMAYSTLSLSISKVWIHTNAVSHFNHASMDAAANGDGAPSHPLFVSVTGVSASRRRLSASFVERSRPVSSEKPMAWLSLQGRLLNADEASSARTIGGGLSAEQALAWNLFPPIHRFLVVAVIGAAVARSRKDLRICHLEKSVELRVQFVTCFSLYTCSNS